MSGKQLLCLSVTSAEEEAIRHLYFKNGWSISTVTKDEHTKLWIRKAELEDKMRTNPLPYLRQVQTTQTMNVRCASVNHVAPMMTTDRCGGLL